MRTRAKRLTPVRNTNRQDNLPEIGTTIAYTTNRDGVAARFAAPAVHKPIDVDLAWITYDDARRTDLALSIVKTARQHDAHTFYRLRSIPGVGKILALGLLYAMHDLHRGPSGQEVVSYCRLGKCARPSAGNR